MSFFKELKRRNVFRVAIAYLISAWIVVQVADLILTSIEAPSWVMKVLLMLMALGFIIALVISWAYEITPEGIKRESEVVRDESITSITAKKLDVITIVAVFILVVLLLASNYYQKPQLPPETIRISEQNGNSIAVLPFIDLSQKGDEGYFADGISEEILNVLVRIPKLKVAGRTSSFTFKGRNIDLRKISETLGVNHILEGSVRRSGAKLRITAQLIRGKDGFHMWSETYDRQETDIFKIQDEIAKAVAHQLALSLGLSARNLVKNRTQDMVAYEKYLKAKQLILKRGKDNLEHSLLLLNDVVARDPDFAPAWTAIANVYGIYESYQSPELNNKYFKLWRSIGLAAAKRSLIIDPKNPTSHTMLAVFQGYKNQWVEAFKNVDKALKLSSGESDLLDTNAQTMLEVGYFNEAKKLSELAVKNDPLVAIYHNTLARSYLQMGENKKALEQFYKTISLKPEMAFPYNNLFDYFIRENQWDKVIEIVKLAVKNGAFPKESITLMNTLIENKNDKKALRKLLDANKKNRLGNKIALILDDYDTFIFNLKGYWLLGNRNNLRLFPLPFAKKVFKSPIWKAQIRKDGVLKLWQTRGFPPQCHPLPNSKIRDDFECE